LTFLLLSYGFFFFFFLLGTGVNVFYVYPRGLREILVYTKHKYNNPVINILEQNGLLNPICKVLKVNLIYLALGCKIIYIHINFIYKINFNGVRVKGFFPWTFMDTFEWGSGFTQRFGITFVDYNNNLTRAPKKSGLWYKKFLEG
ncbi:unnamed protein product, partial [Coffea canephora]